MINENLTLVMIFHEIWNKNDCTCWVYQFSLLRGKYWQPGCIFSSPAAMFYSSSMANGYSRPPMYTGRHFLTLTTHCISRMQTYALLIPLFFCCVHVHLYLPNFAYVKLAPMMLLFFVLHDSIYGRSRYIQNVCRSWIWDILWIIFQLFIATFLVFCRGLLKKWV